MTRTGRIALVLPLLVLAGCASAAPAPAAPTAPALSAPEQAFVDRISAEVDPAFAKFPERYARRGANTCYLIEEKAPDAAKVTAERFSGGTATVTSAQAEKIVAAARDTVCAK